MEPSVPMLSPPHTPQRALKWATQQGMQGEATSRHREELWPTAPPGAWTLIAASALPGTERTMPQGRNKNIYLLFGEIRRAMKLFFIDVQ